MPNLIAAAGRGLRRYIRELRASQAFLAGEVGQPGWLNLGQFRWRNVEWARGARVTFGILAPLIAGIASGHPEYGTFAALGAMPAGIVSFQGVTRSRVLLVIAAAAGMAISTFVGGTAAAGPEWLLVPVIALWCYVAGVCSALGPAAIAVSLQWPVAVLIASALPLSPEAAGIRALLVLAGGLWQGALVIVTWVFSRGGAERDAMAQSYQALSEYAAGLAAGRRGPPDPQALPGVEALRDPNPLLRSASRQYLIALMEEAERIRTSLTALPLDEPVPEGSATTALLRAAGQSLSEVAAALAARPSQSGDHLDWAREYLAAATPPGGGGRDGTVPPGAGWASRALLGQLRAAVRLTGQLTETGRTRRRPRPAAGLPRMRAPEPVIGVSAGNLLLTLRANLGWDSEAGRHALRLAAVTALGEVIALGADLPHGYWVTLTVLIVLRPDYSSTLQRGLQRAGGTLVGAGLGLATALIGHIGVWALVAALGVSLLLALSVLTVNYLFFAIFLTDFVVVFLELLGTPADQTALDRLIGTGIGTGLALLAYLLWPTWERTSASEKFARLFLAQSRFADEMLRSYARPSGNEAHRARPGKLAARRARADAEASADRLADEPSRPPMTSELAQALVSTGQRLALSVLALEAAVGRHHATLRQAREQAPRAALADPGDPVQPVLDQLATLVCQASVQLAESLHRMGPPAPLPPLREVQDQLSRERSADAAGDPDAGADDSREAADADALYMGTDSLVDTLDSAADVLRRYLPIYPS